MRSDKVPIDIEKMMLENFGISELIYNVFLKRIKENIRLSFFVIDDLTSKSEVNCLGSVF